MSLCEEFWFRDPVLAVCSIAAVLGAPFMFGVYYEDDDSGVFSVVLPVLGSMFTASAFIATITFTSLPDGVRNWRQAYAIGVGGNIVVALLFHLLGSIAIHLARPSAHIPSWPTYCAGVIVCASIAVAGLVVWLVATSVYWLCYPCFHRSPTLAATVERAAMPPANTKPVYYAAQPLPRVPHNRRTRKVKTPTV